MALGSARAATVRFLRPCWHARVLRVVGDGGRFEISSADDGGRVVPHASGAFLRGAPRLRPPPKRRFAVAVARGDAFPSQARGTFARAVARPRPRAAPKSAARAARRRRAALASGRTREEIVGAVSKALRSQIGGLARRRVQSDAGRARTTPDAGASKADASLAPAAPRGAPRGRRAYPDASGAAGGLDRRRDRRAVVDFLGTACDADAPLAAAGLDSVGAGEFAAALGAALRMDLPSTTLFDHPTAAAVARLAASAAAAAAPGAGAVAEEPARAVGSAREETADVALVPARSLHLPGSSSTASELPRLCATASVACSRAPATRLTSTTPAETYGAFTGLMPSAAAAFGISKAEARSLDPRADLILRSAAATLRPVANAPVGFFLGCGALMNDAVGTVARARAPPSVYEGTSNTLSVASGRVSDALGLTGPCASLDTACSSSLVAAHAAVSALRLGECPRAVATGVGLLSASATAAFSAAGCCRPSGDATRWTGGRTATAAARAADRSR
ncbi:hypothetical protein JL721_3210 [Aureococcus anophagefferens]|nr:hypothetical protein JL721_3210 [Aureococcus anophagefferens]